MCLTKNMNKYYTNLIILDSNQEEGYYCKGIGWQVFFEQNQSCNTYVNGELAKEIVIYAQSTERAQYVANLILAAHCLYTGDLITDEDRVVYPYKAETGNETNDRIMVGGHNRIGAEHLAVSCLIATKASHRYSYQYAIFKYFLCYHAVPLWGHALDPNFGDWAPGKVVTISTKEHVLYANAITQAYSVLEELSLEIRASSERPSLINHRWNPEVKINLEKRLITAGIDLSEDLMWHIRETPTRIQKKRKPIAQKKTEWASYEVRDIYMKVIDAIAYASWLRSKISAHRLSKLAKSLTICDVANVQHLARRLLLESLGFWRYH